MALVPGQQRYLDKLKAMREHLSNEVASLINDFGPRLYEDFNEARLTDSPACVVVLRHLICSLGANPCSLRQCTFVKRQFRSLETQEQRWCCGCSGSRFDSSDDLD